MALTVTAVRPALGPLAGGTPLAVSGTDFVSGSTVTIGGVAATGVVYVSATLLACVSPAGTGRGDVVVSNPGAPPATATLAGGFSYVVEYGAQLAALLPPGPLWNLESGSGLLRLLGAMGDEFSRAHSRAKDLMEEVDPRTATETIGDWERVLALPDEQVPAISAVLAERRVAVTQKLVGRTGQSHDFFEALIAACGWLYEGGFRYGNADHTLTGIRSSGVLQSGFLIGGLVYGDAYAYTLRFDVSDPGGAKLAAADMERVVRHALHAHEQAIFNYV